MKSGFVRCVLGAFALMFVANTPASADWLTSYSDAIALAKKEGRPVLIDFMGSDWCVPCIQMKKSVLDTRMFKKYAADHLVLLEVDFPQGKPLPQKQMEENQRLGERYGAVDATGFLRVPTVTLVDAEGKILATQTGVFLKPEEVIAWIEAATKKMSSDS